MEDAITDVDAGAVEGIAVIATGGHGTFWFKTTGGWWSGNDQLPVRSPTEIHGPDWLHTQPWVHWYQQHYLSSLGSYDWLRR